MQFKLSRFYPTKLEITVTPQQLISMFPVEIQEHPTMGIVERVWRTSEENISVNSLPEYIINLSSGKKHLRLKDEKMLEILNRLENFEIVLFYENKEDIYKVEKIK